MKKKYLIAALLCSVCMTAPYAAFASDADTAEETEETTAAEDSGEEETEDSDGEDSTEDADEADDSTDDADEADDSTDDADEADDSTDDADEADDSTDDADEADDSTDDADEEDADSDDSEEEELERPEYQALDYVTLGDYKNLTVSRSDLDVDDVTDEDVDSEVESDLQDLAESAGDVIEELTEGEVQEGDIANIDYVGKKDDEAFDGGSAEGYDLEIGSDTFIDGFEDGLIGVAIGDTVDLNLTFPENYGSSDLAGQDVVFTVTVNSVQRMPELTDDLVNTLTEGEYTDLASYRESVKSELEADAEEELQSAVEDAAFTMMEESSEISSYPEGLQEYTEQFIHNYYESYAEMYGMEFEDFLSAALGMTEEEFDEQVVDAATSSMEAELILKAILESEELEITDSDYEEIATNYGYESVDDMRSELGSTAMESLYLGLMQDKAYNVLGENVTIEDSGTEEDTAEDSTEETTSGEKE